MGDYGDPIGGMGFDGSGSSYGSIGGGPGELASQDGSLPIANLPSISGSLLSLPDLGTPTPGSGNFLDAFTNNMSSSAYNPLSSSGYTVAQPANTASGYTVAQPSNSAGLFGSGSGYTNTLLSGLIGAAGASLNAFVLNPQNAQTAEQQQAAGVATNTSAQLALSSNLYTYLLLGLGLFFLFSLEKK